MPSGLPQTTRDDPVLTSATEQNRTRPSECAARAESETRGGQATPRHSGMKDTPDALNIGVSVLHSSRDPVPPPPAALASHLQSSTRVLPADRCLRAGITQSPSPRAEATGVSSSEWLNRSSSSSIYLSSQRDQ